MSRPLPRSRAARRIADAARERVEAFETEEALTGIEEAVAIAYREFPNENKADLYHEVVVRITVMCRPAIATEVRRRLEGMPS